MLEFDITKNGKAALIKNELLWSIDDRAASGYPWESITSERAWKETYEIGIHRKYEV